MTYGKCKEIANKIIDFMKYDGHIFFNEKSHLKEISIDLTSYNLPDIRNKYIKFKINSIYTIYESIEDSDISYQVYGDSFLIKYSDVKSVAELRKARIKEALS
jgi:hypothetical protein